MGAAIKNILQFAVEMVRDFWVYRATLGEFQAFITYFRSMTKHGSAVKVNLSLHNTKVVYHLYHIRNASKLPWLRSDG